MQWGRQRALQRWTGLLSTATHCLQSWGHLLLTLAFLPPATIGHLLPVWAPAASLQPFGPASVAAESLEGNRLGQGHGIVSKDMQIGCRTSWLTILMLCSPSNPSTAPDTPGTIRRGQHTLSGLINPGASHLQGIEGVLGDLEGTYIYGNKVLISTSTREAHSVTLLEVRACLHLDENGSHLYKDSSGEQGVPLLGYVPARGSYTGQRVTSIHCTHCANAF